MDHNFTKQIGQWLETPAAKRDLEAGARYLLKLSGKQIMYRNILAHPDKGREVLEYQLRKYYNFRVRELTHVEVKAMERQAAKAVERNISLAAKADATPKGRRADHDSLPDEIKALYVENLSLLQRMREVHLRLRLLSVEDSPCPDSERYPFLKDLISMDKKLHDNWRVYDTYMPEK